MKRRIVTLLLAALLLCTAAGCGEKNAADGTENTSAYLRLYCPAELGERNKSAGGGDAVNGIPISWKQVRGDDRGRQQQAQYIMELLLGGCTDSDFIRPMPEGTAVNSCTVTGGTVSVDLSREYDQLMGVERTIADYCITLSLMQLDGIYAVRLTVDGRLPEGRTNEVYTSGEVLLTSPEDIVRTVKVMLYYPNSGGTLTGEERRLTVYEGETIAQAVVKALTERPMDSYGGLDEPLLPAEFTALGANTEGGTCYLNLPRSDVSLLPEGQDAQDLLVRGMVNSLCSIASVDRVQLLLDGEVAASLGQIDISGPLCKE